MSGIPRITTDRLLLREWLDSDRAPFAAMNGDPRVMEHFLTALTQAESDALVDRIRVRWAEDGFGLWAVERRADGRFLGFTGLALHRFPAHFTPAVEVGWRFAVEAWGEGYATEAGRAALDHGFAQQRLDEIVSFTAVGNRRSRKVMERLGMTHDPADDFDHPSIPAGHPLRKQVLYRISPERWAAIAREGKTQGAGGPAGQPPV